MRGCYVCAQRDCNPREQRAIIVVVAAIVSKRPLLKIVVVEWSRSHIFVK
jgi:predicted RNA-binding protein YlxR (DUF448 family)